MKDYIYYNDLYDCYYKLLTDKQRIYFEDYYFQNLSLSEIAQMYNVSRNAAYKQIQNTIKKLKEYEEKLNLLEKKKKCLAIVENIENKDLKRKLQELF